MPGDLSSRWPGLILSPLLASCCRPLLHWPQSHSVPRTWTRWGRQHARHDLCDDNPGDARRGNQAGTRVGRRARLEVADGEDAPLPWCRLGRGAVPGATPHALDGSLGCGPGGCAARLCRSLLNLRSRSTTRKETPLTPMETPPRGKVGAHPHRRYPDAGIQCGIQQNTLHAGRHAPARSGHQPWSPQLVTAPAQAGTHPVRTVGAHLEVRTAKRDFPPWCCPEWRERHTVAGPPPCRNQHTVLGMALCAETDQQARLGPAEPRQIDRSH